MDKNRSTGSAFSVFQSFQQQQIQNLSFFAKLYSFLQTKSTGNNSDLLYLSRVCSSIVCGFIPNHQKAV
jgi:hypothetical protein